MEGTAISKSIKEKKSMALKSMGTLKKSKFDDALNEELDPPTCLSIRFVGHSFPPGS